MPDVSFRDRGRFELKGFPERWRLYEAVPEGAALPPRWRRRPATVPVVGAGAVLALALAVGLGAVLLAGGDEAATRERGQRAPPPTPVRAIDDSERVVLGRAIGDANLGMSEAEVLEAYGRPESTRDWTSAGNIGSILTFTLHGDRFRVYLFNDEVVGLTTESAYYQTDDGLRVGARVPLPEDSGAGITRNAARDFIWHGRYVYRDVGGGCNFWFIRGFRAVTEFIMPSHGVRRVAGIRIADETLADDMPREIGRCR